MTHFASWCLLCGKDPDHSIAIKHLSKNLRITIGRFTKIRSTDKGAPKNICTNCDTFIRFYEKQKEHYHKVQEMFTFALKKSRKPQELVDLRTKFNVSDELQDWKSLGLVDVKVKLERLDNSLYESFIVNDCFTTIDESFLSPETKFVVKAEPMSPRPASPETFSFLPQYSPDSDLPNKFDNSPPPSPAEDSDSGGLSDHFEIIMKRGKVKNPNRTTSKTYKCDLCGYTICWKVSMMKHMKMEHTLREQKVFKCDKCPREYKHDMSLRMHIDRNHKKPKPPKFHCELCEKKFSTRYLLHYHVAGFHENRRDHQCSKCSKMFLTRGNLKQHELSHNESKDFHCTFCPKRMTTSVQLKRHMKRHNKVACFCEICGAKAASTAQLQVHKKFVHGNVQMYTCIVCEKQFKRPKDYKEHLIAIHTDLRPYSCAYCSRTFNNGPNFIKHKRETHPVEFAADKKRFDLKPVTLPSFEELHKRIQAEC